MIEARSEARYDFIVDDSFKFFLGLSVIFHLGLFLFFAVKMAFFPSEDIVIKSAVRVDIVALPDKVQKPVPKAPPAKPKAPAPKPKVKTPKKKDLGKIKAQQSDAIKRLQAIEKLKASVKPKPAEPEQEFKGNVVTKGSQLKGLDKFQYDEYFAKLETHVKKNWVLPQWLTDKGLRAQVLVKIDNRGFVIDKQVVTSSGNVIFDNNALKTIERSSPCPVAPDRLQALFSSQGVIFNFP